MIYDVYFSAFNGTNMCSMMVSSAFRGECERFNWRREGERKALSLSEDDVLVFSMPVYGGFIPSLCVPLAESLLEGDGTPAVIVATFGNRAYDNALRQMTGLLESRGFRVVAAGAFVCRHSIFSTVAQDRPDSADRAEIEAFAERAAELAGHRTGKIEAPCRDDSDPSSFRGVPFHPDGRGNRCTSCGSCVRFCTTGAIDPQHPWQTDSSKCIACGACIKICPAKARDYHMEGFMEARLAFEHKCASRQPNACFYAGD